MRKDISLSRLFLAATLGLGLLMGLPQAAGAARNLLGAEWQLVTGAEREKLFEVTGVDEKLGFDASLAFVGKLKLSWTQGHLYRITSAWKPSNLFLYYLSTDGEVFHALDGTSPPIHNYRIVNQVSIDSSSAVDYLWFFTFFVRAEEGPFLIVESVNGPYVPRSVFTLGKGRFVSTRYSRLTDIPRRAECAKAAQGDHFECNAVVMYSNALFEAKFAIMSDGMVEMTSDEPLVTDLPARVVAPIDLRELDSASAFVPRKRLSTTP